MLRVAAALLCIAAGQVTAWLIYPAGTTHSLAWPAAATVAAGALIAIEVRRRRANSVAFYGIPPPGGANEAGEPVDLENYRSIPLCPR